MSRPLLACPRVEYAALLDGGEPGTCELCDHAVVIGPRLQWVRDQFNGLVLCMECAMALARDNPKGARVRSMGGQTSIDSRFVDTLRRNLESDDRRFRDGDRG